MINVGILRNDYELFSLQENLFYRKNIEMNIIMVDTSSLRYGCLVHYYCLWCIGVDTQVILQRGSDFLRNCLRGGRVPKLAGLPTSWVKEIF